MLQQIFLNLLDMSVAAGYCAIVVMIIRLFMKKLPKSYSYVLWAVVFVRLMLPVMPETLWSLLPDGAVLSEEIFGEGMLHGSVPGMGQIPGWNDGQQNVPEEEQTDGDLAAGNVQTGGNLTLGNVQTSGDLTADNVQTSADLMAGHEQFVVGDGANGNQSTGVWEKEYVENIAGTSGEDTTNQVPVMPQNASGANAGVMQGTLIGILSKVWLAGSIILIAYGGLGNLLFKKRLKGAVQTEKGIFELENLPTAFVTGVIKPRIYLPAGLPEEYRRYVLVHEQNHVQRGDIWVKYVTYFLTSIHWFNPFVWIAFGLMCKDMEMSCDERVLRTLGLKEKKAYSTALLSVASGRRVQLGMPVAFSESDAKSRINNVLNYRRPTFWVAVTAGVVLVALAFGLLSNPESGDSTENESKAGTESSTPTEDTAEQSTESTEEQRAELEQEITFRRQSIMRQDLYDRSTLSQKLSHEFNLPFLFEEYEDVNEIEMSTFRAILFDYANIEVTENTAYYFDGQKLMEEFCIMTGQDTEEFLEAHSEQGYNTGKQYHTIDGDNMRAFVTVKSTNWVDEDSVQIYYECWDRVGYHLWDGMVTMKRDGHYLKFVANERLSADGVEAVTENYVTYIYKNIEETELIETYPFPEEEIQRIAREFTGDSEVHTSTRLSQRDGEYFYGKIECYKLEYSQFCDLGVIIIKYSVADGTVDALAEIKVDGATAVSGPVLQENKLFWSMGFEQEVSYRYDLETDEWSEIEESDIPENLNGEKVIQVVDEDKGIIEIVNKESNLVEQQVDLADSFGYGYVDSNGYLMYCSAYVDGFVDRNIWIHNLKTGESVKLFAEQDSGYGELGICNDKFYIYDDSWKNTKLELIDMQNNLRVVYGLPDDLSTLLDVSDGYLIFSEYNEYEKSLNVREAIEYMR